MENKQTQKDNVQAERKYLQMMWPNKGLIFKIYKQLPQFNKNNANNNNNNKKKKQSKNWQKT